MSPTDPGLARLEAHVAVERLLARFGELRLADFDVGGRQRGARGDGRITGRRQPEELPGAEGVVGPQHFVAGPVAGGLRSVAGARSRASARVKVQAT